MSGHWMMVELIRTSLLCVGARPVFQDELMTGSYCLIDGHTSAMIWPTALSLSPLRFRYLNISQEVSDEYAYAFGYASCWRLFSTTSIIVTPIINEDSASRSKCFVSLRNDGMGFGFSSTFVNNLTSWLRSEPHTFQVKIRQSHIPLYLK